MSEHYQKIQWHIELVKYLPRLLECGLPRLYDNNLIIKKEYAFEAITELRSLNRLLLDKLYKIISISVVNTNPGIFGGIHVDRTASGRPLQLRLNIPLEHGDSMINRWYNIKATPFPEIYWNYQVKNLTNGDRWFLDNKQQMIEHHCIDTLRLTGPTFFKSSVPHNVDGTNSLLRRRILSIVFSNSRRDMIADWDERGVVLECINKL